MATAVRTFTFDAGTENLTEVGISGDMAFGWDSTDEAIKFTTTAAVPAATETARTSASTETWEDYGVPSGNIVTAVQVTAYQRRLASDSGITQGTVRMRIVSDDASVAVHDGTTLINSFLEPTTASGTYSSGSAGTQRNVAEDYQPATTNIRFEVVYDCNLTGGSINVDYRLDNIEVTVTYEVDPSANPGAGTGQGIYGMGRFY